MYVQVLVNICEPIDKESDYRSQKRGDLTRVQFHLQLTFSR